ncbi:hypothetical protein KKD70_05220 [Patescibacteria group bacterium]|nr:hypothetical protein [Patescibacteria group bacterium]
MSSFDNNRQDVGEKQALSPTPATQDLSLKQLDSCEITSVIAYVKALNRSGLLHAVHDYSPEKDKLEVGDEIIVCYDSKDRETISRGGSITNGYTFLIDQKVRITKIDEERARNELHPFNILVEEILAEDSQGKISNKAWISLENILIID